MADFQNNESRTETATPRRRQKARQKGQVARSADLTTGLVLLVATLFLWKAGPRLGATLHDATRSQLRDAARTQLEIAELPIVATSFTLMAISVLAAFIPLLISTVVSVNLLQSGFALSLSPLQPEMSKLSWSKGFRKLWSRRSLLRGLLATAKLIVLAVVAWSMLRREAEAGWTFGSLETTVSGGWAACMRTAIAMSLALLVIGLVDWGYQRWQHEVDLRMSLQEIKDERKEDEGDPLVRARVKKLQREAATRRMLNDVATSTVVVRNPTHYAVAIRYDRDVMSAPCVVAKGADFLALQIIELAERHDVPVVERRELARALYAVVDVGEEVPTELYQALVEILAYVYSLRRSA